MTTTEKKIIEKEDKNIQEKEKAPSLQLTGSMHEFNNFKSIVI